MSRIDFVEAFSAYRRRIWHLSVWFLIRGLARYPAHLPLLLERVQTPAADIKDD